MGQSEEDSLGQQALTTLCGVSLELPRVGSEEEPSAEEGGRKSVAGVESEEELISCRVEGQEAVRQRGGLD